VALFFKRGSALVFCAPVVLGILCLVGSYYLVQMNSAWPNAYLFSLGLSHSAPYLAFMFIGVAFHYAHANLIRSEVAITLVSLMLLIFAVIMWNGPFAGQLNLAWNYGFAVLVFGIAATCPKLFRASRIGDFFADISYPLYAIHGVAGYVALRLLIEMDVPAWLSLVVVTCTAIAFARVIHVLIEVPSHNLGRHLGKHLSPSRDIEVIAETATDSA